MHFFEEHHRKIEPDALDFLMATPAPLDLARAIVADPDSGFEINRFTVLRFMPQSEEPASEGRFELIYNGFQNETRKAAPQDAYHDLFANRYKRLSRMLAAKSSMKNIIRIGDLSRHHGEEISLIGMVTDVRISEKAKHVLLTLDDPTGQETVLIPKDSNAALDTFLNDEVVGVRAWVGKDGGIPIVKEVARPDVPVYGENRRAGEKSYALFLSDLHVGSKMFLKEPWYAMLDFLKGDSGHEEIVDKIHHIVVAGDLVDGIGIYPGQERDLAIMDIVEQYKELGRLLSEFPRDLNIVVIPGNHDAVCPAEPQPSISPVFASLLPRNVRTAGNPSLFALDGVMVQAYHGRSFDNMIPSIPGARYESATDVMKRMLSMRHLSPTFGEKLPLSPLPTDGLIIDPLPDIFVTGHTHTAGVGNYRGVTLINASAWIAETDYQRMRNVKPEPAKGFLVDLSSHQVKKMDFTVG